MKYEMMKINKSQYNLLERERAESVKRQLQASKFRLKYSKILFTVYLRPRQWLQHRNKWVKGEHKDGFDFINNRRLIVFENQLFLLDASNVDPFSIFSFFVNNDMTNVQTD